MEAFFSSIIQPGPVIQIADGSSYPVDYHRWHAVQGDNAGLISCLSMANDSGLCVNVIIATSSELKVADTFKMERIDVVISTTVVLYIGLLAKNPSFAFA